MSTDRVTTTTSGEATEAVGERLAGSLEPGDTVLLLGDLAAGKTTLVRGLLRGLGGDPTDVTSPSFVLVQTYHCSAGSIERLHHVDLYRLHHTRELAELGLEELFADLGAVTAVEWPRHLLSGVLPSVSRTWEVTLAVGEGSDRRISILR